MRHFTATIQPGNSIAETCVGNFLTVKQCNLPLTLTLGGSQQKTVKAGSVIPMDGQKNIGLKNGNAVAVTVSFEVDDKPGTFVADDNSTSNATNYAFGNLGIATGAGASGGLPACDANGFLQVTNGMNLAVSGTNNGHRRQILTFSLSGSSPAALNVLDANGLAFMTILAGQQIALVTDAAFTISGAGGTAWVTVGQIFLNS